MYTRAWMQERDDIMRVEETEGNAGYYSVEDAAELVMHTYVT